MLLMNNYTYNCVIILAKSDSHVNTAITISYNACAHIKFSTVIQYVFRTSLVDLTSILNFIKNL